MNKGPTTKRRAKAIDKAKDYQSMLARMSNIVLDAREKEYQKVQLVADGDLYFFSKANHIYAKLSLKPHGYVALQFSKSATDILYTTSFHYLSLEDPAVFRHLKWLINNTY